MEDWSRATLENVEEIFVAKGVDSGIAASALIFAPDGKLMMTLGGSYVFLGTGEYAQDPDVHYGKVLRLNADGTAPDDNPFVESGEYLPEVYSVGHRNQLGMASASRNGPALGEREWSSGRRRGEYHSAWKELRLAAGFLQPKLPRRLGVADSLA